MPVDGRARRRPAPGAASRGSTGRCPLRAGSRRGRGSTRSCGRRCRRPGAAGRRGSRPNPSRVMRTEANRRLLASQATSQTLRPMGLTATEAAAVVQRLAAKGMVVGDGGCRRAEPAPTRTTTRRPARCRPTVPLAGAADVDARGRRRARRAPRVAGDAAARADRGPPPARRPARRARRRGGAINALDNGTPIAAMRLGRVHRGLGALLRGLGRQARRRGRAGVRSRRARLRGARAVRRGRRDRPVERPDDGHGPEGGAGARGRQHGGGQAAGDRAVRRVALRRARARGRPPAGRR